MHLATLVVAVCVAIASSLLSTALIVPKINVATSDGSLQPLNTREIKAASVVFFNNGSYVFNIDASCSAVRGAIQLNNLARQRNLLGRSGLNTKKTTVVEKKESQHVVETRSDRVKRQAAEQDEYDRLAHLLDGSPVHQCSCACQNRDSGRKKLRRLLIAFDETEEAGQVIGVNGRVNNNNNAQSSSSSSSSTFVSKQHTNDINREQPLDVAIVNGGGRGQNQGSFSVSETESHKTISTNENGQQTNGPFNNHLDRLSEEDRRRKEQQQTGSFSESKHEKIETTGQINGQFNNHLDRQRDEEERRKQQQQTSSFSGSKSEKFDFGTGKHGKLTQNFLDKQREEEERRNQQQGGSKVISSSVSESHKSEVITSGNGENGASLVNGQNNGGLLVGSFNQNMMNQREEDARRRNQEQSGGSATSSSSSFSQTQHENEQKTINNLNGGSNVGTFEQDRIRQSEEDKKRRQTGQSSTVISNTESHNEQVIKTENGQNGASLISGQNNGGLLVGAFNQNMMNQQEEELKRLQQQGQQGGANQVTSSSVSESHKVIKTENGKNVDNINHSGVLVGNFEQDRQRQREEEQRRRNEQQGGSAASSSSSTFSQTQQANNNNLNGGMYVGTFDADRIRQGEEDEKRRQNGQSSTVISQSESHKETIKTENGVNGASLTSGQNNGGLLVGAFNQNMMNQQEEERKRLQQQGGANQVISSSSSESHKVIRTEDGKNADNINNGGVLVGNFEQDRQRQREEEERRKNQQQGGAATTSSSSSSSAESHKVLISANGNQIIGHNEDIGAFNQNLLNKQREEDERRNQQGGSKVISSTISESHKQVNRSEIGENSAGLVNGQNNGGMLVGAFNQDTMNQQEAERRRQQEQHGGAANQVVLSSTSESPKGIDFEDGDTIIVNKNNSGTTFELDRMRQPAGGSSTLISKTEESHKEQVIKTENSQNGASLVNGQNNGGLQVGAFNQNLMNQQEEERKRQQQSGSTSSSSFSQSQKVVSSENGQNVNVGGVLIGNFEQDRQRQREEERRKQQGGSTTVVSQSESHKGVTKTENGQNGASLASGQNNGGLLVGAFNQNLMNQQEEERKRQQQSGSTSSSSFSQSQKVVSSENGQNVNAGGVLIGNFEQDRQRQREEEERRKQQGGSTTVVSQSESHKEVTKTENGQNVNGGAVSIGTFEQDSQRQRQEEENRRKRERVESKSESKEFHKTESSTQVQENGKINPGNVVTPLNALEQQNNGQASSSSFSESHNAKVIKTSEKSGENLTADQIRDRDELKRSQQQQQQEVSSSSSTSETHKSETVSGGNIQNGIELTAEQKLARVRELEEQARKAAAQTASSSSSSSSSTSTKEVAFVQTAAVSPQAAQQQGTCSFAQFGNWLETSDAFIQALSPAELVDSLRPGARLQRCDVYFQHGNKRHPGLLNYRLVCHGRSSGDEQLQAQEQIEGKAIVSQQNGPVVLAPLIEANNAGSKIVESKIIERKEEHHVVVNKAKSTRR